MNTKTLPGKFADYAIEYGSTIFGKTTVFVKLKSGVGSRYSLSNIEQVTFDDGTYLNDVAGRRFVSLESLIKGPAEQPAVRDDPIVSVTVRFASGREVTR